MISKTREKSRLYPVLGVLIGKSRVKILRISVPLLTNKFESIYTG